MRIHLGLLISFLILLAVVPVSTAAAQARVGSSVSHAVGSVSRFAFSKGAAVQDIPKLFELAVPEQIQYLKSRGFDVVWIEKDPSLKNRLADRFGDQTLGKYLSPKNPIDQVTKPTLVLSEAADPWTVTHEFLHGLFEMENSKMVKAAANEGRVRQELAGRQRELNAKWTAVVSGEASAAEVENYSANLESAIALFLPLVKNHEIEEILIEKYLQKIARTSSAAFLTAEHLRNSEDYVNQNLTAASGHLQYLAAVCAELSKRSSRPQLKAQCGLITQTRAELAAVTNH